MGNSETHLFIIWEKATPLKEKILSDIASNFSILNLHTISWSRINFSKNMSRFYGEKLPKRSHKERHCGRGPFTLVIVSDENPTYEERMTSKGKVVVNARMFDAKERYRSWTGGGHKIHATNSVAETKHDLVLLLGINLDDYNRTGKFSKVDSPMKRDLIGSDGWSNISELFYVINECCEYVVLRNHECLPDEYHVESHGDIDILCKNRIEFAYVSNAKKENISNRRVQHKIKINGKHIVFDFRYVGDSYYCSSWESDMLEAREKDKKGFYRLNDSNYFYSLLYHAVLHKEKFPEDYKERLSSMAKKDSSDDDLIELLREFMAAHKYTICQPVDYSVQYNLQDFDGERRNDFCRAFYFFRVNAIKWMKFLISK